MSNIFWAKSDNGKFSLGSEHNAARFRQDLKDNIGARYKIERVIPESSKQRRFFEGGIIPLITYYQEGMDYKNSEDLDNVREWIKLEFNGEYDINIAGKIHKKAKSTKGMLNKGFLERVIDWFIEQYAPPMEALDPEKYKDWRDRIRPAGGEENYIDHLISLRILKWNR